MNKVAYFRAVIVACIIITLCISLSGCCSIQEFNWTMYGTVFDANGQASENLQFTVEGIRKDFPQDADQLNLEVLTPDSFPYSMPNLNNVYTDESGIYTSLPYFASLAYAYDKVQNNAIFAAFALDVEHEYIILIWSDIYLVGYTDPNTDPTAVFDHFQAFVDYYSELID
ncbi:MAG: hypothetical protein J6A88_02890 [Oscillospiraceae bacterium]|nr:hypothetical protein [Oscillospiraceae bacterium]